MYFGSRVMTENDGRCDGHAIGDGLVVSAVKTRFSAAEVYASLANQFQHDMQLQHDAPLQTFTVEQTKEAFDVARNIIELLLTVLSISPQQDTLKDYFTTTLVQQCRQSQSTVLRIIDTTAENEALLFEDLNVNDEIQKTLSKYEELKIPKNGKLTEAAAKQRLIEVRIWDEQHEAVRAMYFGSRVVTENDGRCGGHDDR
ncbi:TOM1-like protein 1 [Hibiscus syriacus]|uniref:TOM1-like protein 1 n=1 Tax=Hibiscus syriacus TaxID=106335 RepID=UPI001924CB61|nr:TOM1-like protein 1 [Hibiscus syriacus]